MTRKKRTRKVVRNPLELMMPMARKQREIVVTQYWIAFRTVQAGNGTERDLYILLKVCELLYIAMLDPEMDNTGIEEVRIAARGIRDAVDRGHNPETVRRWGFDGNTMWRTEQIIQAVEQMLLSTKLSKVEEWLDIWVVSIRNADFKCLDT